MKGTGLLLRKQTETGFRIDRLKPIGLGFGSCKGIPNQTRLRPIYRTRCDGDGESSQSRYYFCGRDKRVRTHCSGPEAHDILVRSNIHTQPLMQRATNNGITASPPDSFQSHQLPYPLRFCQHSDLGRVLRRLYPQ